MNRLSQHTMIGLVACGGEDGEQSRPARPDLSRRCRAAMLVTATLTTWILIAEAVLLVGGHAFPF